ncbi:hypothetical protein B0T26DRAFT_764105 [Lasiosphaeria miniovina]|uniref:Uncharacterized protein n=1 Tax=Lasiosphaeria miniovina TaxID=1954250 RepID=A0AA40B350_9PEZI|nr:uncharacterized protein B0T26DRAFT_764105 [Lasiosphaeria miniovina]KAK0726819.1 hypothetical protein B0T26DRAFT_764105 [Lasiosphaeria miniovina]
MRAKLKFLADLPLYDEKKPSTLYGFPDHIQPISNCEYEVHDGLMIQDTRGHEQEYHLDEHGFEFHHWPSKCDLSAAVFESNGNREEVWRYLKETITLTELVLQAPKAMCFDWGLRRTNADCEIRGQLDNLGDARYRALPPTNLMHCDYSYDGGLETLKIHLSPYEISEGRCKAKIINVWRPMQTVCCSPLVLCDRRTVHPKANDIVDVDQVAPTKAEQSITLTYRPTQGYHWLSNQQPEEVTIFTSWTSDQDDEIASAVPIFS